MMNGPYSKHQPNDHPEYFLRKPYNNDSGYISDSESAHKSDDDKSACTNPYLEGLLERYFPSDEEDFGWEADGEYEFATILRNGKDAKRQKSPLRKRSSPIRNESIFRLVENNSKTDGGECKVIYEEEERTHQYSPYDLNTAEWFQEARRQYVDGASKRRNAWDSGTSSMEGENNHEARDTYTAPFSSDHKQEDIGYEDSCGSTPSNKNDIKKSIFFAPMIDNRIEGVASLNDHIIPEESDNDGTDNDDNDDDDDLELTYRARQIQLDLRFQEMKELAIEAERAAEEGIEKFVGHATRFGPDTNISVNSEEGSPTRGTVAQKEWKSCGKLGGEHRNEYNNKLKPTPRRQRFASHHVTPQRPRPLSFKDRLSSAPSILQNNKNAASASLPIGNVPTSVSSILTSKSFLSLAHSNYNENKVHVLSLRHIEEVIPTFGEMHSFLKSHMKRAGVNDSILNRIDNQSDDNQSNNDEKGSATGSKKSTNSLFPRISSFHRLFQNFSGLSVDESGQNKSIGMLESDLEIGPASDVENRSDYGENAKAKRTSLVINCGRISSFDEIMWQQPRLSSSQPQDFNDSDFTQEEGKEKEKIVLIDSSDQSENYICTLAAEINSPNRRPRSPPPKPLYNDAEGQIFAMLQRNGPTTPPRSKWTAFWANISPTNKPRTAMRSQSLPLEPQLDNQTEDFMIRTKIERYHSDILQAHNHTSPIPSHLTNAEYKQSQANLPLQPNLFISHDNSPLPLKYNVETAIRSNPVYGLRNSDNTPSNRSNKTEITQPLSYESESSAFSRYSKHSKPTDSVLPKIPDTSLMNSIKEDDNKMTKKSFIPINTKETELTASPKPPLHPAGMKLVNNLLNHSRNRKGVISSEIFLSKFDDTQNPSAAIDSQQRNKSLSHIVKCGKSDQHVEQAEEKSDCSSSLHIQEKLKQEDSLPSPQSCCLVDDVSVCREEPFVQIVAYNNGNKVSGDSDNDNSSVDGQQMSSFMNLMENVNVPNVMDRFSPLLGSRKELRQKEKPLYQDDAAFVGNYFYMEVGVKSIGQCKEEEHFHVFPQTSTRFCVGASCAHAGCEDFGTSILDRTFKMLSKKSSWQNQSGPLINVPANFERQPWLHKALSKCAGERHLQRRREEVIIGDKRFRAPLLQIQKGGFFSKKDEYKVQAYKVKHKSTELCSSSGNVPIHKDDDFNTVDFSELSMTGDGVHNDYEDRMDYKRKMKRTSEEANGKSLFTFSDHSDSDN